MIKDQLMQIVGADYVVADDQLAPWSRDWSGAYQYTPLAVVRPANTQQVSQILRLANETGTAVVPVSGNTGLAGGAEAEGSIQLSLDRMNRIREMRGGKDYDADFSQRMHGEGVWSDLIRQRFTRADRHRRRPRRGADRWSA